MTVEALLEQLKKERMDAMASAWIYGAEAQEAMCHDEDDVAKMHIQIRDENYKKAEQLYMIIKEIEKRVS